MDDAALLTQAILRADAQQILEIVSADRPYPADTISQILCDTSITCAPRELLFSGSGGTGKAKPNYTSLTAVYFAAAGHDVLKFGSRKVTGIFGSTDFFEHLGLNELRFSGGGAFSYHDVCKSQAWYPFRNLLCANRSFREYLFTTVFNPILAAVKFAFTAHAKECLEMRQYHAPGRTFTICSEGRGSIADEAGAGCVYADGVLLCCLRHKTAPTIRTAQEAFATDMRLLAGLDRTEASAFLIDNMSIPLMLLDGVSHSAAREECQRWYRRRIVFSAAQDSLKDILNNAVSRSPY